MAPRSDTNTVLGQAWVAIVGAAIGVLTLAFFMVLIVLGLFGRIVPCDSAYLVYITISLGSALSASFLGGNAVARGAFTVPLLGNKPIAFGVGGGVAVLIIMLIVTQQLFGSNTSCRRTLTLSCPAGFQGYAADVLGFGFCYPREGWELDSSPIALNAGDIYMRNSSNRDVGLHFHISLVPAAWAGKPDQYTDRVARTWSQLDSNIRQFRAFVGGRDAYGFSLNVKDKDGAQRPTEVLHVYLDSERLLEVIQSAFDTTQPATVDIMQKVRSTLTFSRV
jgi:hypothetical protein